MVMEIKRSVRLSVTDIFGGIKTYRRFLVTEFANNTLKESASFLDVNDSLLIECIIRSDGLDKGIEYYKEQGFVPEKGRQKTQYRHGEVKKSQLLFTITAVADKRLDEYARKMRESRGEVIECAVRGGGIESAAALIEELRQQQ